MAIDTNKPEPPQNQRNCCNCGKNKRLKGTLIHWPDKDCEKSEVTIGMGPLKQEPFSMWIYECAWCRAIETKRKAKSVDTTPD